MSQSQESTFRERTLATRYRPRLELPFKFPAILKEYAREVLRAQPESILEWSADYFKKLALETEPTQANDAPCEHLATPVVEDDNREELARDIMRVYADMDTTGTKLLYANIIKRTLMDNFGLSEAQALYILTSHYVIVHQDGTIEYEEFVRNSVHALQFFQQTGQDFVVGEDLSSATVHDMTQSDLDYHLKRAFSALDVSGTGRLTYTDYRSALMNAPLNLTERDIRILCLECDRSFDTDEVEYAKEVPLAFQRLLLSEFFDYFDKDVDPGEEYGEEHAQ